MKRLLTTSRGRTLAVALVAALAGMWLASPANAQGPIDSGQPQWTADELRAFLDAARMTDTPEARVILDLYASLTAEHRAARKKFFEANQRANLLQSEWYRENPGGGDPWRDHGLDFGRNDLWIAFRDDYHERERRFLADVDAIIGEAQRDVWLDWRRDMDRRHTLAYVADAWRRQEGFRSLMNLTDLVDSLDLDAASRAGIADVESAYEEEMGAAISDWHEWQTVFHRGMLSNTVFRFEEGTPAAEAKRAAMKRFAFELDARLARIVDVNDRAIPRIRARLAPDASMAFQDAVDGFRHPSLALPCPVELAMRELRAWPDASEAKRAAADVAWSAYEPQRRDLRRRIVAAHDEWETPQRLAAQRAAWVESFGGSQPGIFREDVSNHPARPLLRRSLELARDGASELLAALGGPDAIAHAPLALRMALRWWDDNPADR
jgi:hypothetical protein